MTHNTIYFPFFVPPITGGDFITVEHIAGLNRMGFDARALYLNSDLGYLQFDVPIVQAPITFQGSDIIVIGEIHKKLFDQLRGANGRKVLHNQAPYYTFAGFDSIKQLNDYPLECVITSSDFAKSILLNMGVTRPIYRIRPFIPSFFVPGKKTLQIAFSPDKRPQESWFLRGYFQAKYSDLAHIPWIPLTRLSRAACAQILAQSAVYAAFPLLEGLGLMNLEAMAAGCLVVGYTGHGGSEYATKDNGIWIEDGNHEEFARKLGHACELVQSAPLNGYVENALATAHNYSLENFEKQLKEAYLAIMGPGAETFRRK